MDEMTVQAEYIKGTDPERIPQLKKKLEAELKEGGLRSIDPMLEPNRLERTEFKARRVIDRRSLYDHMMNQS